MTNFDRIYPAPDSPGSILIVDDLPDNLRVLNRLLSQKGYDVRVAISGQMALSAIHTVLPELILLDICMPDMDGYEVCARIKADSTISHIPVIFVSALSEVFDKVKAFEVGGVDYITKPFQVHEVLARVQTHLKLTRLQQQLQINNEQLQREILERKQAEEKYRSVLENSIQGFFQITPDGKFLIANPALAHMYGYDTVDQFLEQIDTVQPLYVQPKRWDELYVYLKEYNQALDFESEVYQRNGTRIWISETIRVVRNEQNEVLYYEGMVQNVTERHQAQSELYRQRRETERLLLSILPESIAERLKRKPGTIADSFNSVTVMFADIVDFTQFATHVSAEQLVESLNQVFSKFDQLAVSFNLEKIKTIGDEYMVAGGIPVQRPDHAEAIANMAIAMQTTIQQFQAECGFRFQLRIGINTGPVIAGVIGTRKFTYDLWGETVNLASRMQSQGMAGKIQVTPATYELLKHRFVFEERGPIDVKGMGQMHTYWLSDRKH